MRIPPAMSGSSESASTCEATERASASWSGVYGVQAFGLVASTSRIGAPSVQFQPSSAFVRLRMMRTLPRALIKMVPDSNVLTLGSSAGRRDELNDS